MATHDVCLPSTSTPCATSSPASTPQRLNASAVPDDMNVPGFRLHQLKGDLAGFRAVTVRANWRIVFRFEDGHAVDVDYLDYH